MKSANAPSLALLAWLLCLTLLGCHARPEEIESFPPENWQRFVEPLPPSFVLWAPEAWQMVSTRGEHLVGPTAFLPLDNPNHVAISTDFPEYENISNYDYTLEQDTFKAFCLREVISQRVTHSCMIGPYPNGQFIHYTDPERQTQVVISFNFPLAQEEEYQGLWENVVKSFIYEQPPLQP